MEPTYYVFVDRLNAAGVNVNDGRYEEKIRTVLIFPKYQMKIIKKGV